MINEFVPISVILILLIKNTKELEPYSETNKSNMTG